MTWRRGERVCQGRSRRRLRRQWDRPDAGLRPEDSSLLLSGHKLPVVHLPITRPTQLLLDGERHLGGQESMVDSSLVHFFTLHLPEMVGVRCFPPAVFLSPDRVVAKTLDQVGLGEGMHTVQTRAVWVAVDAMLALCGWSIMLESLILESPGLD